jgi:hypothetical protein
LLQHPTIDRLRELGLEGMAKSLRDLTANPESHALDHRSGSASCSSTR